MGGKLAKKRDLKKAAKSSKFGSGSGSAKRDAKMQLKFLKQKVKNHPDKSKNANGNRKFNQEQKVTTGQALDFVNKASEVQKDQIYNPKGPSVWKQTINEIKNLLKPPHERLLESVKKAELQKRSMPITILKGVREKRIRKWKE